MSRVDRLTLATCIGLLLVTLEHGTAAKLPCQRRGTVWMSLESRTRWRRQFLSGFLGQTNLSYFWNASKFHRLLFASSVSCTVSVGRQAREQIHVFP